ncbi:MAG: type II secretion system protein [Candidatus Saccharimonadales bacterium]
MPKTKAELGFTITELLVTIAFFAITIPVLAGLISMLDGVNDRARDIASINGVVENKIEGLRSISFAGLTDGTTDFTNELPASIGVPRSANYTIAAVNAAIKQIDVTVIYNDHGNTRTLTYRTYIGELGVGQY